MNPEEFKKAAALVERGLEFIDAEDLCEVLAAWSYQGIMFGFDADVPDVFVKALLSGMGSSFEEIKLTLEAQPPGELTQQQADTLEAVVVFIQLAKDQAAGRAKPAGEAGEPARPGGTDH